MSLRNRIICESKDATFFDDAYTFKDNGVFMTLLQVHLMSMEAPSSSRLDNESFEPKSSKGPKI